MVHEAASEGTECMTGSALDDAFLCVEAEVEESEPRAIARGEAVVWSSRCPGKTTPNEDAAALVPTIEGGGVLIVADGMGGGPAGEQASGIAIRAMAHSVEEAVRAGDLVRSAILNAFDKANDDILALGVGAGTTLALVEIQDHSVRPYHVGDSMILLVGQRGRLKLQSISHSPVGYAVEAGVLDETEALHHEARHLVSNMLGSADMRIELGAPISMARRDTLLLATDGLFDNLRTDEIVQIVRTGRLARASKRLVDLARSRMTEPRADEPSKPDDLTFLLYRRRD